MAERVGFEPTVEFPQHSLSRRALSTAQTPLRVASILSNAPTLSNREPAPSVRGSTGTVALGLIHSLKVTGRIKIEGVLELYFVDDRIHKDLHAAPAGRVHGQRDVIEARQLVRLGVHFVLFRAMPPKQAIDFS